MATALIEIELFGGPGDGLVLAVPASSEEWSIPTPLMTPAQFIAMESGGPYVESLLPIQNHVYVITRRHGNRSHALIFDYVGPRKF